MKPSLHCAGRPSRGSLPQSTCNPPASALAKLQLRVSACAWSGLAPILILKSSASTNYRARAIISVSPGADPQKIRLRFRGAKKIRMNAQGDIVLKIGGRSVILHRPVVYQETEGLTSTKQHVEGRYVVKNGDDFGFQIGAYDAARPLVIDPALTYSSFLGGSNADSGSRVAVDSAGNAYIVGVTNSADFPVLNPLQSANEGSSNVFVTKINATRSETFISLATRTPRTFP